MAIPFTIYPTRGLIRAVCCQGTDAIFKERGTGLVSSFVPVPFSLGYSLDVGQDLILTRGTQWERQITFCPSVLASAVRFWIDKRQALGSVLAAPARQEPIPTWPLRPLEGGLERPAGDPRQETPWEALFWICSTFPVVGIRSQVVPEIEIQP